jgi:hypothetical protein
LAQKSSSADRKRFVKLLTLATAIGTFWALTGFGRSEEEPNVKLTGNTGVLGVEK